MSQSLSASPAFFGDLSIDHAIAGFGAGTVATLVMHPLDLVKVRFQLAETPRASSSYSAGPSTASSSRATLSSLPATGSTSIRTKPRLGTGVYNALAEAVHADGWKGLYRGLVPNLVGGASSWGLYFLLYNMIKKQMQGDDPTYRTSSGQHLLAAAEASAVTAMVTNPIWVVKTRVFATGRSDPAYRGLWTALSTIYTREGIRGLYKGSLLALVGVSNGSIQFATYEAIKRQRADIKRRLYEKQGKEWKTEDEKLTNMEYILASGSSKLVAIALTYPYQVVRARIQNGSPPPPAISALSTAPTSSSTVSPPRATAVAASTPRLTIPGVIASMYRNEGLLSFYKGLGTNALRILPGTCTTFVVYENLVWLFRAMAIRREEGRLY